MTACTYAFDVFVGDVCRSVLTGGKMIICRNEVKMNPGRFVLL